MTTRLTPEQREYLLMPLRSTRIAHRNQGGKQLSYLESWDVRAHLNRIFGFCGWDEECLDDAHMFTREYRSKQDAEMVEVGYKVRVRLTIKDVLGSQVAVYTESAVGSTSGPASMLGEHHDNALKTAASDALKRCAINLGTQFGLSLYDNGNKSDVVRGGPGITPYLPKKQETDEHKQVLADSLGVEVTPTGEATNEGSQEPAEAVSA